MVIEKLSEFGVVEPPLKVAFLYPTRVLVLDFKGSHSLFFVAIELLVYCLGVLVSPTWIALEASFALSSVGFDPIFVILIVPFLVWSAGIGFDLFYTELKAQVSSAIEWGIFAYTHLSELNPHAGYLELKVSH